MSVSLLNSRSVQSTNRHSFEFNSVNTRQKCRGFCSLTVEVSGKGPDAPHVFGLPDRVSSGAPFVLSRSDGGRLAVVSASS